MQGCKKRPRYSFSLRMMSVFVFLLFSPPSLPPTLPLLALSPSLLCVHPRYSRPCYNRCRRCVQVVARQCLRTVSCLSVTFFLISRHRVIKMLPHNRLQTRWSVCRFTNLPTQLSLATCNVHHLCCALQRLHVLADDVTLDSLRCG